MQIIKSEMGKNKALHKEMEMKDEFISMISHEFKGKGSKFTVILPAGKVKKDTGMQLMQEITDNRLIRATALEFSDVSV